MSSSDDRFSPEPPDEYGSPVALPPVQPPSASFILQLFLIPLLIVTIIVGVWLLFSWMAHMGNDPRDLVDNLRSVNNRSWQDASALADMLRSGQQDQLKNDEELARRLAAVLEGQIDEGRMDADAVRLRQFLCHALGEFRVAAVGETLVRAAETERDPAEVDVRSSALEALAVLATNVGAERLRDDERVMAAIMKGADERGAGAGDPQRTSLRERAAFVLGVIGGTPAQDKLHRMLNDRAANVRYNAATGLARRGDPRAVPVLLEMLDPHNPHAVEGEEHAAQRDWKRLQVLTTGIRAAQQLGRHADPPPAALRQALDQLIQSELESLPAKVRAGVRLEARAALRALDAPGA